METEVPVIRGKKRGEERKGGRNLEPASPSRHGDVSLHNRSCLPGGTGPCPHGQLLPRSGHSPARRPLLRLSSPAAGKGLTPSSCSPDAGSGIHICVIINLGESAAAGGWLCPPLAPHSEPACGCQGAAGEGWQPRCCGILPPDSQRDELGAAEEPACFPQHFPFSLLLAPTVLGHPAGPWGGAAERVPPSGAGLGCNWFQERGVRRDGHKFP